MAPHKVQITELGLGWPEMAGGRTDGRATALDT